MFCADIFIDLCADFKIVIPAPVKLIPKFFFRSGLNQALYLLGTWLKPCLPEVSDYSALCSPLTIGAKKESVISKT